MVQIINSPSMASSMGSALGGAIGGGLGEGFTALAQHKVNQLLERQQQDKTAKGFEALQAYSEGQPLNPDQYRALSALDPKILQGFAQQQLQRPSKEAFAEALGGLFGAPQGQQGSAQSGLQALSPEYQQELQQRQQEGAGEFSLYPQAAQQQRQQLEQSALQQSLLNQQQPGAQQVGAAPGQPGAQQPALKPKPQLNEKQALELAKLGLEKQKMEQQDVRGAFKATQAERKEIIDKARAARQNLKDLERFEELEKEGKLDTPGYVEFLNRSGLDIPALMEPGSEEFNKIAANFLRDAKTYFGSRITQYEVEQFLKTIPSLSQSPEGRKRVIANLKYLNRGALEYNDAYKEVLAENKGVPPLDLMEKIDDRIDVRLDKIHEKFKEDISKPVPKGQNKLITALQASLGSAVGAAGGLVKSVGSLFGAGKIAKAALQ